MENDIQQLTRKERRELKRQEKREHMTRAGHLRKIKSFVLWGGSAALVVVLMFFIFQFSGSGGNNAGLPITTGVSAADWVTGADLSTSSVVLLEYGDFQCPACGAIHPILKQLKSEFGNRVIFAYRHLPLTSIHLFADIAARASEAAGLQGKFWAMHDMLYENQDEWIRGDTSQVLANYARRLGLNIEQFQNDLNSNAVRQSVQDDQRTAAQANLNSTPSFFLNGDRITPASFDEFRAMLNDALNEYVNAENGQTTLPQQE